MDAQVGKAIYGGVLEHDIMTIGIPLQVDFAADTCILTDLELLTLRNILAKMVDRNFDISVPGWKFDGLLHGFQIGTHRDHGTPELILEVSL